VKGREWYQSDDVAATYEDKRFTGGGRLIDDRERAAVQSSLSPVEDRRVLEIACGTGRFSVMLARGGADVVGLDVSSEMLGQAREKAHRAGADAEWVRGDAARLPFPDDAFDAVLAMRFFHLADTPASFLAEMRRVARDQVVFDTFNARSARSAYNWLLPMGSRLYTDEEVRRLLGGAGLRLAREEHDFVVPYGFYRQIPSEIAGPVRRAEATIADTTLGERLASVSFWDASVGERGLHGDRG
jgi:ubiquinone/menaquinone biosynthesis C-methylase UbiE